MEPFDIISRQAYGLGKNYGGWDADQFIQSDVAVNVVAPQLREMAGFRDAGMGTYTEYEINQVDDLGEKLNALWDAFWGGFYEVNEEQMQEVEVYE
jgi:hypothetical protein